MRNSGRYTPRQIQSHHSILAKDAYIEKSIIGDGTEVYGQCI